MKTPKRPRDQNQLAKMIVDMATGALPPDTKTEDGKDPLAVALGRRGGLKGGKARAEALSKEDRQRIAKAGAAKRWGRKKD